MAKILDNKDAVQTQCSGCKSLIEITRVDLKYYDNFGHHSYLYFECPACGRKSEIKKDSLPSHWKQFVDDLIAKETGEDF